MEDNVKWATEIIDQKLELEQENEVSDVLNKM